MKLCTAVQEYYHHGRLEVATLAFQEVNPLPALMSEVVKDLLCQCVELSAEKDCCTACVDLLVALHSVLASGSEVPVLNAEQLEIGVNSFIRVVDKLSIDWNKAVSSLLVFLILVLQN